LDNNKITTKWTIKMDEWGWIGESGVKNGGEKEGGKWVFRVRGCTNLRWPMAV
jgi:hypothetical protein